MWPTGPVTDIDRRPCPVDTETVTQFQCLLAEPVTPLHVCRLSLPSTLPTVIIRVTSSTNGLKHMCVDLSDYNRYLNQIWYRTQIQHYQHARMAKFT